MKACKRERYIFPVKKLGLRDNSAGKFFYMADVCYVALDTRLTNQVFAQDTVYAHALM